MALGSTQSVTEMSTTDISWRVKAAGAYSWQSFHLHIPTAYKFWERELPGALRACLDMDIGVFVFTYFTALTKDPL